MQKRGYTVLAISPDLPEGLQAMHSHKKLNFPLFSDSTLELTGTLGVVYHMDYATVSTYLNKYNVNLEKASGQKHHNLPVPTVLVTDAKGIVKFVYTNPDHTVRLSNEELLKAAP